MIPLNKDVSAIDIEARDGIPWRVFYVVAPDGLCYWWAFARSEALMTSARTLITSGSSFERDIGYSRAVVQGDWIFVSGTTGFDYATMTISDEVVAQAEQSLRNVSAALQQAGATLADVVRVTYIVPRAEDFPACWPVLRQYFGEIRPAATMISAGLADPRMKIEIEVTALRRGE